MMAAEIGGAYFRPPEYFIIGLANHDAALKVVRFPLDKLAVYTSLEIHQWIIL